MSHSHSDYAKSLTTRPPGNSSFPFFVSLSFFLFLLISFQFPPLGNCDNSAGESEWTLGGEFFLGDSSSCLLPPVGNLCTQAGIESVWVGGSCAPPPQCALPTLSHPMAFFFSFPSYFLSLPSLSFPFSFFVCLFFSFCLLSFRATPTAYGTSQAMGLIGGTGAGLCHSHSNARSEPRLRPTPQLMATRDP